MNVAWGFKPHSGWAVAVLVGGSTAEPVVLDRRRVVLCPDNLPRQAYHAVLALDRPHAAAVVRAVASAVATTTAEVVRQMVDDAGKHGRLVAVAVVGEPRDLPELDKVLANHARLHAAEGEMYRAAVADAAGALGVPVVPAAPKNTMAEAASVLGVTTEALTAQLTGLRAELGAPWQADHKAAAAAGLAALARS